MIRALGSWGKMTDAENKDWTNGYRFYTKVEKRKNYVLKGTYIPVDIYSVD